jgi:DNA polymerase/3'-5' exonuclease PolX
MNTTNKKDIIIKELETMSKQEVLQKNFFKVRAYRKVLDQLKDIDYIGSMDDVSKVEGIGAKIKAKIEEILKSGKLKSAERARESRNLKIYDELLQIHGIGIVKAEELVNMYGITTVEKLKEEIKKKDYILNDVQKTGLKFYDDIKLKIPRNEMDRHNKKIKSLTKDLDKDMEIKMVGSYRRGAKESGDIDLILTTSNEKREKILKKVVDILKENNYLIADLGRGKKKYMGICQLNKKTPFRRIDILTVSYEEYPFALLYFTGDFQINISLRKRAIELGYRLSENSLKKMNGREIPQLETEKEIFNFLGYKYIQPKNRTIQNLKELI